MKTRLQLTPRTNSQLQKNFQN